MKVASLKFHMESVFSKPGVSLFLKRTWLIPLRSFFNCQGKIKIFELPQLKRWFLLWFADLYYIFTFKLNINKKENLLLKNWL